MMHTDTNEENLGAFIKLLDVALQHKVCIGRHIRNGLGQLGQWISLLQMPALGGVHSAGDQAQSIDSIRNFSLVKLPCFCRCSLWSRESCSLTGNNSAIKLLECSPPGRLTEEADSKWRQTSVYYCQGLVYFLCDVIKLLMVARGGWLSCDVVSLILVLLQSSFCWLYMFWVCVGYVIVLIRACGECGHKPLSMLSLNEVVSFVCC